MDIIVSQRAIARIVARAESAIDVRSSSAVSAYVLLNAYAGAVTAAGTSHIKSIRASCDATVNKTGAILVRDISDKLAAAPAGEISLRTNGTNLEIRAATSKAKKPLYSVPFIDAADYPPLPAPGDVAMELPSSVLARLLLQTAYAAPDDETKASMSCVRLECDGHKIIAVSAQSARMARAFAELDAPSSLVDAISTKGLKLVQKALAEHPDEPVKISVTKSENNNGHIHLTWSDATISLARVDDGFPPWRKVWPGSFKGQATVNRSEMVSAIERAERVADKEGPITMELSEGKIEVSCKTAAGESNSELSTDYAGKDFTVYASAAYVKQALSSIHDDDVVIKFNDHLSPLVFEGATDSESCSAIVMPMKH
jgi:DNA polymerase-3 subunit beta